jgi:hypothetical protein
MGSCFVKPAKPETGVTQTPVSSNQEIRALLAVRQSEESFGEAASIVEVPFDQMKDP